MKSYDDLLTERYGTAAKAADASLDAAVAGLLGHRSVRAFTQEPVGEDVLEQLVAAAQSASSSSNLQTWSVVAVRDPARKARLAEYAGGQRHVAEAPLVLVWIADISRLGRMARALGETCEGLDYLESLLLGVIDAALAAQNAAVAAEARGLGIVYLGALRNQPEKVAAELGLPHGAFGVFGMCVGHPDPARPAAVKPRLPQSVVLHREQYSARGEAEGVAAYDAIMTRFYTSQAMNVQGWSGHSVARIRDARSLNGRDRLSQSLKALGFAIK